MRRLLLIIPILILVLPLPKSWAISEENHPLFQYVNHPDPAYSWEIAKEEMVEGGKLISIKMVSQIWQGIKWEHKLDVVVPSKLDNGSIVGLLITGGGDGKLISIIKLIANKVGIPMAVIFNIPNQPLFGDLSEDALLAYTFMRALETQDMTWPALYPMTKSVVRAMDTIQAISKDKWGCEVKGFVVTGASKRGWTTWFTGIVDKRVIGIAPMVYDNLNIPAQMKQQLACYGTFSEQIEDYSRVGLVQRLANDPVAIQFSQMIDPYVLRFKATMPKFIINGSNDRYWTLESANLYFPNLIGEKHILYVPNAGHSLGDGMEAISAIAAFSYALSHNQRIPSLRWMYEETENGLKLKLKPEGKPLKVRVWIASSPSLDFRDAKWEAKEMKLKDGIYEFTLPRPKEGYSAMFGEARYKIDDIEFAQSTTPKILK